MTKKKKMAIAIVALALIAAASIFFLLKGRSSGDGENTIYMQKVAQLTGEQLISTGRFSGVVEAQKLMNFKKSSDKPIETIYVKEGDKVEKDTPLFKYNVSQSENDIASANLDIEGLNNEIAVLKSSEQTTEIQLQIEEKNLEIRQKQADIAKLQKEIDQSIVRSTIKGVVKKVNDGGTDQNGSELPIVSVTETGEFRVKGKVSEQSISFITKGQKVIIRSRVDESKTWGGSISNIETEPQSERQNEDMFAGNSEGSEKSSVYPFYVTLDSTDGLMLGQHVFIEPVSEGEVAPPKEGLWLDMSLFVTDENGKSFVWSSKNGKLIKKEVELGEPNEETFSVEVKSGLSKDDFVTWPDETLKEGMKVAEPSEGDAE